MTSTNDDHGGRGRSIADELGMDPRDVLDLSATLNPLAPDVSAVVRELADATAWYPDASVATSALAAAIGVDPERLVLTNGGSEAIALVAALEPVGSIDDPEFSLYRRHLDRVEDGAPRWRSNPNNPLGHLAAPDDSADVWDEAFYAMTTGCWTRGDDAWRIGSLTKLWACPGLRIGYVIAPDDERAILLRARQPAWSVSSLALASIPTLLDQTDLTGWAKQLTDLRDDLRRLLESRGHNTTARDAPWVLVADDSDLSHTLLRHGIVTRDCTSFGMPNIVRVSVTDEHGLERVSAAIA